MATDTITHFGNWLRYLAGENGGPRKFAAKLGINSNTMQQLFTRSDDAGLRDETWGKLEAFFKKPREQITKEWKSKSLPPHPSLRSLAIVTDVDPLEKTPLPVLPQELDVFADGSAWTENLDDRYAESNAAIDAGIFIARIRGDSMSPEYPDGSKCLMRIIRLDREPWPVGSRCCVHLSDGRETFKELVKVDDDTIYLKALNTKYPKMLTAPKQMVARICVALYFVRDDPKAAGMLNVPAAE